MTFLNDPLPSWHEGKAKQRIIAFVEQVTSEGTKFFVPEEERIATFDNDGTLWIEKPILAQLAFYKRQLFDEDVLANASMLKRLLNWMKHALLDAIDLIKMLFAYLRSGLTTDEYRAHVSEWIKNAKHPHFDCLYTDLTYLPMLELLDYLSAHGFSNYMSLVVPLILSGLGQSVFIKYLLIVSLVAVSKHA